MRNHKKNHTKVNLFLDIVLIGAFLVSLKPFSTGLAIHEWLGLAIGAGIVIHILLHWAWMVAVTKKLFGKAPQQARLYYGLDAALLAGFFVIIGSGVLMSRVALSFLGLRGANGAVLALLHKVVSYGTLTLLVVKLGLHWKWIVNAVRCHILGMRPAQKKAASCESAAPAGRGSAPAMFSRRQFLTLGGSAVCLAFLIGKCNPRWDTADEVADANTLTQHDLVASQNPMVATAQPAQVVETAPTQIAAATATPVAEATPPQVAEATPTAQPTQPAAPTPAPRVTTRCPYGMVNDPYPGRCRRYTDQNGNGICDLSETA